MKIINELGNEIEIEVSLPLASSQSFFQAVYIRIEGPNSCSENTITLAEAKELARQLNAALANQQGRSTQTH